MKSSWSFVCAITMVAGLSACSRGAPDAKSPPPEMAQADAAEVLLSPELFQEKYAELGGTLLDVRTAEEVADGRIAGATNIDVRESGFDEKAASLNRSEPVFTYCRTGRRGAEAARRLRDLGFEKVYELDGGIVAWEETELPIER